MSLREILDVQMRFSTKAFGPGHRTKTVLDHIRKELKEIEADPLDLEEWIDVAILALEGAWRTGHTPREVEKAYSDKLLKNMERKWPDWRTADADKAIEHIRT